MTFIIRFAPAGADRQVEIQADNSKMAFLKLAKAYELFGINACGKCNGHNVFPNTRRGTRKDGTQFDAHEWRCGDCNATLRVGTSQDGSSFFIRWDAEWEIYEKGSDSPGSGPGVDSPPPI